MPEMLVAIVFLALAFVGAVAMTAPEVLSDIVDGRRKLAAVKGELKTARRRVSALEQRLDNAISAPGGDRMAAMTEQARVANDDRAVLIDILRQVKAADDALPQLPRQVREEIDEALARHRARLAPTRTKKRS